MSRAVAAVRRGHDYQARFFWARAGARLLRPRLPIARVGFDVHDVDGFDDVVIERCRPDRDEFGRSVLRDLYQVKFHVDHGGELTIDTLTNPREIGGTRYSFLERLKRARQKLGPAGTRESRFNLVSTYHIARDDLLKRLISTSAGGFRTWVLREGGSSSQMGRLRSRWREHLELGCDEDLIAILEPLCIWPASATYKQLQDELEQGLPLAGLRVPDSDAALSPYEDLIWKLHGEEQYYFDPDTLRRECERAGLVESPPVPSGHRRPFVYVRSFARPSMDPSDAADEYLSLLGDFDGRFLAPHHAWPDVRGQLCRFFGDVMTRHRAFDLQIDAHASLAFAAGAQLHAKLGLELAIVQMSRAGQSYWSTASGDSPPHHDLAVDEYHVGRGNEVALVLAITRDAVADVLAYVELEQLSLARLLVLRPTAGSSQAAVRDGQHALAMADETERVIQARSSAERGALLHMFAAAPNGLVFFLGQLSQCFGRVTLYEYDFEQTRSGGYEPSFSLPDSTLP